MTFQIADERDQNRYTAYLDGAAIGYAEWILVRDTILVPHMQVSTAHHDEGIGSLLLRRVLNDARAEGRTMLPLCHFARRWTQTHPEYRGVFRTPLPGELTALHSALATAADRRRSWTFGAAAPPAARPTQPV